MQSYEKRLKRGIFDAKEKIIQQLDVFLEEQKRSNMLSKLLSVKSKNDPWSPRGTYRIIKRNGHKSYQWFKKGRNKYPLVI